MIDHMSTYATDYEATKGFYLSCLEPLGFSVQMEFVAEWNNEFPTQRLCAFGPAEKPIFWVIESKVEHTPRHVAFQAVDRGSVDRFYQDAILVGGIDNGGPGLRPHYHEHYYGAYVLDPDGNNVEAVCHLAE